MAWVNRAIRKKVEIPSVAELRALLFPPEREKIPGQIEFLRLLDERVTKYVAYRAGIGAGKTWIGAHRLLECAARNPKVRGFVAANTYPQLFQSTLSTLYEVAELYGVPIYPKTPESAAKKKMLYLWNQVEVICRSAENIATWDGFKVGYWWLDEAKDMDQLAYRTICERHRDTRMDFLEGWMTASPSGHNWFGDLDTDPDVSVVTASTKDNPFLPDDYVDSLLTKMTPEMVAQQIEGKVLNTMLGECYAGFSRAENVKPLARGNGEFFIGIDFNVEPGMHAYLIEIQGNDVFIHEEIYLRGGDTPQLGNELLRRYGTEIPLVPDAAGGQRHTTGTSDHKILKEMGFRLRNRPANPPIKDRVNSVSSKILNAKGERHLFVDPSCKLLINDLERCTWEVMRKESYRGPLTHPGAALGYTVHLKFPFSSSGFAVSLKDHRRVIT